MGTEDALHAWQFVFRRSVPEVGVTTYEIRIRLIFVQLAGVQETKDSHLGDIFVDIQICHFGVGLQFFLEAC